MRLQGFRGNCDSQGKLGMCPSLAEPVSGGFPRKLYIRQQSNSTELDKSNMIKNSHKERIPCGILYCLQK